MAGTTKVREIRLRRRAERQGLELHKSRRRDPFALGFNSWWLVDASSNDVVHPPDFDGVRGCGLDDIERYLTTRR